MHFLYPVFGFVFPERIAQEEMHYPVDRSQRTSFDHHHHLPGSQVSLGGAAIWCELQLDEQDRVAESW